MALADLAAFVQYLQGKGRGGQRQPEADNNGRLQRLIEQQGHPANNQPGHDDLCGAQAKHHVSHLPETRRFEFDTNDEQQKDHAKLGDITDFLDPAR